MPSCRIGIIGHGFIGAGLLQALDGEPGLEIVFVHARRPEALEAIAPELRLADLAGAAAHKPDLIVEAAGPDVSRLHGKSFLAFADYMPLSLTALVDDGLHRELLETADRHGRRLLIAHGALVGLDSLVEWADKWAEVEITFRKPPRAIDFHALGRDAASITCETILFDGSVREIAVLFPHNVNAMVACALATVGLDRCRARMVADPAAEKLTLQLKATGRDGSELRIERNQPAVGVSGSEMVAAVAASVRRAAHVRQTLQFL